MILFTVNSCLHTHSVIQCDCCTYAKQLLSNSGLYKMIARSSNSYLDSETIYPWNALDRVFLSIHSTIFCLTFLPDLSVA